MRNEPRENRKRQEKTIHGKETLVNNKICLLFNFTQKTLSQGVLSDHFSPVNPTMKKCENPHWGPGNVGKTFS